MRPKSLVRLGGRALHRIGVRRTLALAGSARASVAVAQGDIFEMTSIKSALVMAQPPEVYMKKFLISLLIFSILILAAGACTPALTATSAPSETPAPVFTETHTPTVAPTIVITPTPTINPNETQYFGTNREIVTTGADMTLWAGTPQEQNFKINPENADKLYDGLLTFVAMENWHGNEAIRNKYKNFLAYEQYLEANPVQSDVKLLELYNKPGSQNAKQHADWKEIEGQVDLSKIDIAVADTTDSPEREGWIHVGAGIVFKMEIVEIGGVQRIKFLISDKNVYDDEPMANLGLNPQNDVNANAKDLVQALNFLTRVGDGMSNNDTRSVTIAQVGGGRTINFASRGAITKSDLKSAAMGVKYIVPAE